MFCGARSVLVEGVFLQGAIALCFQGIICVIVTEVVFKSLHKIHTHGVVEGIRWSERWRWMAANALTQSLCVGAIILMRLKWLQYCEAEEASAGGIGKRVIVVRGVLEHCSAPLPALQLSWMCACLRTLAWC